MLLLKTTSRFLKDLKLAKKRGYDIDKLEAIVDLLQAQTPLPPKNKDHTLTGEWNHHRECHNQPDWLLIYRIEATILILERTGTHADLFS
ncbi:MAG TPA: type II toxin-antitoxin system YafQ family toxin [Nitrospira sp.]|nr:type II toxin-antitoxin system YafQ family toxin [Nitrospira sp.]